MIKALRGGHSINCEGATGFVDEYKECQKIYKATEKHLQDLGVQVINCNSNAHTQNGELTEGVTKCNNSKADEYFTIHMNAFKTTTEAMGFELWVYDINNVPQSVKRIREKFKALGFKDRGIKESKGLFDLRKSKCKACIIEVCFCDSKADTELYQKIGFDNIGKAIAEGITGKNIVSRETLYKVQTGAFKEKQNAEQLSEELKKKGIDNYIVEG